MGGREESGEVDGEEEEERERESKRKGRERTWAASLQTFLGLLSALNTRYDGITAVSFF